MGDAVADAASAVAGVPAGLGGGSGLLRPADATSVVAALLTGKTVLAGMLSGASDGFRHKNFTLYARNGLKCHDVVPERAACCPATGLFHVRRLCMHGANRLAEYPRRENKARGGFDKPGPAGGRTGGKGFGAMMQRPAGERRRPPQGSGYVAAVLRQGPCAVVTIAHADVPLEVKGLG